MFAFSRCVILLVLVSGCAQVAQFKKMERPLLATAADELLDSAVYGACIATSIGAIGRRYSTQDRMDAWRGFCSMDAQIQLP